MMFALVICKIFKSRVPQKFELSCASLSPTQKYLISIDHDLWRLTIMFAMPKTVALSQCTGVLGCGCPRSAKVCWKIIAIWQLWNNAPISNRGDITVLTDSNWSQELILLVVTRKQNLKESICFKLTNECWKMFSENYGKSWHFSFASFV